MSYRTVLESLQLPIALGGLLLLGFAVVGIVSLPSPPADSEGFVHGMTMLVLFALAWIGFIVFALGLAIPVHEGYGITFNRRQRGLFVLAAIAAAIGVFGPFLAFGLLLSNPSLMGMSLVALFGVAILSLLTGLVWRAAEAIVPAIANR